MCSIVYDGITDSKVCGLIMNTKIEIYYERNIFPSDKKKPIYFTVRGCCQVLFLISGFELSIS